MGEEAFSHLIAFPPPGRVLRQQQVDGRGVVLLIEKYRRCPVPALVDYSIGGRETDERDEIGGDPACNIGKHFGDLGLSASRLPGVTQLSETRTRPHEQERGHRCGAACTVGLPWPGLGSRSFACTKRESLATTAAVVSGVVVAATCVGATFGFIADQG